MDPAVKIVKVEDLLGTIDSRTLAPSPHTQVTYLVGTHGPFILVTPTKEFTAEYVDAETTKRANQLRAIGALLPS